MSYSYECRKVLFALTFVSALWAGREFKAGPGEEVVPDELLVQFRPGAVPASVLSVVAPGAHATRIGPLRLHVVKLPPGLRRDISTLLANHPDVEFVEPNHIRHALAQAPNDPDLSQQWSLQAIEAVSAWTVLPNHYLTATSALGPRIKVAVLDTGVDCSHPDFQNSGGTSSDAAQGGQISYALSQAFVASTKSIPGCPWADDNGHGTHTAGTVAAATNNATGVAALGYPTELIIYKVLDSQGSGSDATIAQAITAAADAGATIISLSLGGPGYSQTLQNAVTYAWQHNTLLVAAAGNSSTNQLTLPAGANHAVGVAATDSTATPAYFSNFGTYIAIAAPGVDILSTAPTYPVTLGIENYALLSGTSMSTPHVAALAGMIAMTTPSLSVTAVLKRIQQSASSSSVDGGWDQTVGYGVIDAYNALVGNLHPASTGSIVGQVVDSSSLPVSNAVVTAGGLSITTNSSGLFRLASLAAGTYTLSVTAPSFPMQTRTVTVLGGADTDETVAMGVTTGTFSGTVTSAGVPVAGVVVDALSGGLVSATAITDLNGMYSLVVLAGIYDLRASGVSRIAGTVTAQTVAANGSLIVNIPIDTMGTITGFIRDPNHNPLVNAQISVTGAAFSTGAITDSNGHYSTIGLPTGTYTVTASAIGFQDTSIGSLSVTTDAATEADIQMGYSDAGYPELLVNAGGPAYTDPLGRAWSADSGFSGGNTYSVASSIQGTSTPGLYQDERYGAMQYQFLVPYGAYTVNLKFAELYYTSPGQRIFTVVINGQIVLANFDIVAAAGSGLTAVDRQIPVNATNGQITIQFNPVLADPVINAIEITPVTVSPSGATITASQSQQFSATVSGTANTAVSWSVSPGVGSISPTGLYSAPPVVSIPQTVTVTAASAVNAATLGQATVTLVPPGGERINAGGSSYTDPGGRTWIADSSFTGGSTYSVTSSISGTNTPALYRDERYGAFSYQFPVVNGTYNVNLKFAELYYTSPGQRVFNVAINGQAVLTNFDIVATAGAGLTAIDRTFPVVVTNGLIAIQWTRVLADPVVNAIEITPQTGVGVSVSPNNVTLTSSQTQQFTASVTGTANTAVAWSVYPAIGSISSTGLYTVPANLTSAQTLTVTATSLADQITTGTAAISLVPSGAIRVNAGGSAYTDPQGNVWSADTGFSGGSTYSVTSAIAGTNTPALYQVERYGAFSYQFPVLNGSYSVRLKFADLYFTSPGQRIFNVSINGQTVLTNFDIVAAAGGGFTAVDEPFAVNVTNGLITIQLTAIVSTPTLNAIEISPVTVSPASVTVRAGQTQAFTASTAVNWSVNLGTISAAGLYTAPASISSPQVALVTATSAADPSLVGYAVVNLVPASIRVNTGGPAYTDPQGNVWSADTGFSGGGTYSVASAITGTTAPALYQNERYGAFSYQFPVVNGTHTVILKFAELYFNSAGNRSFNVTINGQTVLSNFDIVAAAGSSLKAIDQQFSVNVTNGQIAIQLTPVISTPTLNAIEID